MRKVPAFSLFLTLFLAMAGILSADSATKMPAQATQEWALLVKHHKNLIPRYRFLDADVGWEYGDGKGARGRESELYLGMHDPT